MGLLPHCWRATRRAIYTVGVLFIMVAAVSDAAAATKARRKQGKKDKATAPPKPAVTSLTSHQLLEHVDAWTTDVAIMFYAPWCPYCKLLSPYWDMVGRYHQQQGTKDLVVAKFDCERDDLSMQVCVYMGIEGYPTLKYMGAGNYHQGSVIKRLFGRKKELDRAVDFDGPADPEVMKDWTNMMHGISTWHRQKSKWLSLLGLGAPATTLSPKDRATLRALEDQVHDLKEQNRWLQKKAGAQASDLDNEYQRQQHLKAGQSSEDLEEYYAKMVEGLEGADLDAALGHIADDLLGPLINGQGDPFVALKEGALGGNETLVLRCVGDFAGDYCRELGASAAKAEPFCGRVKGCVAGGFRDPVCRPERCPFGEEGCERVSNCMREGVMQLYAAIVEGESGVGSSAGGSSTQTHTGGQSALEGVSGGGAGGSKGFFHRIQDDEKKGAASELA